jgi:hypothetical protein
MGVRTVRLDAEAEKALAQIRSLPSIATILPPIAFAVAIVTTTWTLSPEARL